MVRGVRRTVPRLSGGVVSAPRRTVLDRILDRVTTSHEVTLDVRDLTRSDVDRVIATAEARGLDVSGACGWLLFRAPICALLNKLPAARAGRGVATDHGRADAHAIATARAMAKVSS